MTTIAKIMWAILGASFVVACHAAGPEAVKNPEVTNDKDAMVLNQEYVCNDDSQCKIAETRCGCNNGGGYYALHEILYEQLLNKPQPILPCPMIISNHWSCTKPVVAKCVEQRCVLVVKEDETDSPQQAK